MHKKQFHRNTKAEDEASLDTPLKSEKEKKRQKQKGNEEEHRSNHQSDGTPTSIAAEIPVTLTFGWKF